MATMKNDDNIFYDNGINDNEVILSHPKQHVFTTQNSIPAKPVKFLYNIRLYFSLADYQFRTEFQTSKLQLRNQW